MIYLELTDNEYPFSGFTHTREVARGIVFDERGRVAIHRVFRDDAFGRQGYFETPGGGVDDGESFEEALRRECLEELGAVVEIGEEIGEVKDAYHLIGRRNVNRYYFASIKERAEKHFASLGDTYIQETLFVPLEEAISRFEAMDDHGVSGLVKRRELPILREAMRREREKR